MIKKDGSKIKVLFASNDSIALDVIDALKPDAVLTTKSIQSGRKVKVNEIQEWAIKNGVKFYEVEHLLKAEREEIQKDGYDVLISFSFSRIFGEKFLSIFKGGAFNIHPSSLPQFRGASPIQSAILNGLEETDIVMQTISLGMDEGDIILKESVDIDFSDNYITLSDKIRRRSKNLIEKFIECYPDFEYKKQEGTPTYTSLISKDEGLIDFSENGKLIERKIRAYVVFPRMRCTFNGKVLIITEASFQDAETSSNDLGIVKEFDKKNGLKVSLKGGYLYIKRLQLQGKAETDYKAFYNGYPSIVGTKLEGKVKA